MQGKYMLRKYNYNLWDVMSGIIYYASTTIIYGM